MPELKQVALADIDEPPIAARAAMDEGKLTELQMSMAMIGLLSPIGVKVTGPRFEIEYGHRRFVCATRLGWRQINALVYAPGEIAEGAAMLAENNMREELSAAEEALLFAESQEKYSLDEEGLCKRFNVSPDYLGDRMRLLRQDEMVFKALLAREINFSVARELNKCEDEPHRRYLLDIVLRSGCSARVVADYVRQWRVALPQNKPTEPAPAAPTDAPPVAPYRPECAICGGHRDPYNLVTILIHKWEWEMIQKQLKLVGQGEECES